MAIDRVWQAGAETGNTDEFDSISGFSVSSGTFHTGAYSFLTAANHRGIQGVPDTRQLRTGFFHNPQNYSVATNATYVTIGNITIRQNGITKAITLYISGVEQGLEPGIVGITDFYHLGIDAYIHSASGWAYVYVDGAEVMSFNGNTGDADITQIIYGFLGGGAVQYWDDFYIDDMTGEASPTAPPIKRFYPLIPNGDGNYSQWTPIPTGSHYLNVDDRPSDGDTSYLESVSAGLYDSFTMDTFTLDTNEDIIAMIPFSLAKRGSTTELLALGTRSSGTDSIGSSQNLSTSYNYVWERQTTGSLGSSWNQSYMDSVEVVIISTGTY
jgi:hypothetical protein